MRPSLTQTLPPAAPRQIELEIPALKGCYGMLKEGRVGATGFVQMTPELIGGNNSRQGRKKLLGKISRFHGNISTDDL